MRTFFNELKNEDFKDSCRINKSAAHMKIALKKYFNFEMIGYTIYYKNYR